MLMVSRASTPNEIPTQPAVIPSDTHIMRYGEDTINKQVTFRDPVSSSEMDYPDAEGHQNEREPPSNWGSGNSPYAAANDDPGSSYPPYLPPVLEEPSSSFSEAAEDDPLPAIEGLQISGEAYPGRELQACGYSINGTTSCNFEWVRHMEDGSVNYINGAKQPNYLVTADDVDTYLAIEVQPLDNRNRKGELVKVFANEHKKITCDPEMLGYIEKTLHSGYASYKVSYSTGYLGIWEPATLAIKRDGYTIKCSGPHGLVVTDKFHSNTEV
ncbi:Retrotransposon gag protein [Gossypium australe]|uniref:Retrotransposon gag protein n=1 Tax=Gossypium australe TaxID=47621 RepID=A0A5B6W2Y9_9ROSI|nr:Retrotransposon gag protein [Gossypium australe]